MVTQNPVPDAISGGKFDPKPLYVQGHLDVNAEERVIDRAFNSLCRLGHQVRRG